MPTNTPRLYGNVEPLLRKKFEEALAAREKQIVVEAGLTMGEADNILRKLRAMRAGLKQYQPEGSELRMLAEHGHIKFWKNYEPKLPVGKRHSVVVQVYAVEVLRPSDAVKQSLEDFYAGRRSTPF